MATSKISWTEKTWNPTTGCTKLGRECENCYAEKETHRKQHITKYEKYHKGFDVRVQHESTLDEPKSWKPGTVAFVDSMSDLFHENFDIDFIQKVFKVMNDTPGITYQVLTKRADKLLEYSDQLTWTVNIWMGVTVGVNATKHRITKLQQCGAKHKFISFEPLLERIEDVDLTYIDWAIVGGESGPNARLMERDWLITMKDICDQQSVPFYFKQWGDINFNPDPNDPTISEWHSYHSKGGCMLDGKILRNNPSNPAETVNTVKLFDNEHYIVYNFQELITIWELQAYLPFMEKVQFKQLKKSIKTYGINDPILYILTEDGKKLVVEGHTRLRAAIELKYKKAIPMKQILDKFNSLDEIKLWMVKNQIQRRNLSKVERLRFSYPSIELIKKKAQENLSKAGKKIGVLEEIHTHIELAKFAGVSNSTAQRYILVMKEAPEGIKVKMHKGEVTISGAEGEVRKLKSKKEKQNILREKKALVKPRIIPVKHMDTYEQGLEQLKNDKIASLVIIKNESQLESFTPKQKKDFGFFINKE